MTEQTKRKPILIRSGRWVAQPAQISQTNNCVTIYTDPLDPTNPSLDAVDLYNALVTTHVVKKWNGDKGLKYRTAVSITGGLVVSVETFNPSVTKYLEDLESSDKSDALLTPLVALMLRRHIQNTNSPGESPIARSANPVCRKPHLLSPISRYRT